MEVQRDMQIEPSVVVHLATGKDSVSVAHTRPPTEHTGHVPGCVVGG